MFIQAKEKKTEAIRGMPVERDDVLSDCTDLCAALCDALFVLLTTIRSPVVLIYRAHCTEADLASVAGGSFLLAIVNGCKNIMRPVRSDRLPPLIPAATGEGMGIHINLQRNLGEPCHHAQQHADKSSRDNKESKRGDEGKPSS